MKLVIFLTLIAHSLLHAADPSISYLIKQLKITPADIDKRGKQEIEAFVSSGVWQGGYFEADPTIPSSPGSYYRLFPYKGKMVGALYICYCECIVPYIDSSKTILEIGPGHGAWTRAMLQLNPKKISCVDALSAEHNQFWEYVGSSEKVDYHQIKDFSLDCIEDDSIDFVFSFGVFCHISPLPIFQYFQNIYKKLRKGGEGFIMYADFDKKNSYADKYNDPYQLEKKQNDLTLWQHKPSPCWYHLGIDRAKTMLLELGYEIINADVEVNERDPVIHFRKN